MGVKKGTREEIAHPKWIGSGVNCECEKIAPRKAFLMMKMKYSYQKPTQVGKLRIRRGARELSLRNSAK